MIIMGSLLRREERNLLAEGSLPENSVWNRAKLGKQTVACTRRTEEEMFLLHWRYWTCKDL